MGETFSQLGQLFVQSTPTVIFVFALFLILERLFIRPLTAVMKERDEATRGAVERARELVNTAEAKSREYEAALQSARQEVYKAREANRQANLAERERALQAARSQAEVWLKRELAGLTAQIEEGKRELSRASLSLAQGIAEAVLGSDADREGTRT